MDKKIKIEMLFPEFCNLYGDISNIKYLRKCIPDAKYIETEFSKEPAFINEDVNFIYLGPMTEDMQEKVIKKLKQYKERIKELIESNVIFLVTGNAMEIFGEYIENEDGSRIEGLSIFPIYSKRDMLNRHNSLFIGKYENIEILGFKSQFTFSYGDNSEDYFLEVEKGIGLNKESNLEGIKRNNFFATYLLGPILISNPLFTKKLIEKMGIDKVELAFEEDAILAYNQRLSELKKL